LGGGRLWSWWTQPHAHGICDCEFDDYCASRSPWVRLGAPTHVGGHVGEPIPSPLPGKVLPDVKSKKL
jgi:hypothetical protein